MAPVATFTASYSRNPAAYAPGPPALTPLAIPVTIAAGNWLFALVSWRQDAGTPGFLQYPSTVSVYDDAGNFWIPVTSGQPASAASASPSTGIMRCAVWMAPALRPCEFVFVSPTGYQSAVTAVVTEFAAACPWYQITAQATSFTNAGNTVSVSGTPPAGQFTIGMVAWDNQFLTVTPTATGFTSLPVVTATNSSNHTGDLQQDSYYATTTGSAMTLSASAATPAMTVTATEGGSTANGVTLAVRVVTGAKNAAAQVANAARNAFGTFVATPTTPQATINPTATGSFLYLSMLEGGTHTAYTPLAGSTFIYNTGDAVNNIMPGVVRGTATSTAGSAVTLGGSAPTGSNLLISVAEILAAGSIAEDGSTPVVANTTGATTVTSASFTPPPNSLLVAMVASGSSGSPLTMQVTDSGGRTWYRIAVSSSTQQNASVWVADTAPVDFAAALITVSGVNDARAFPYSLASQAENWPVLVTEIAAGATLNKDPVFAQGATFWSGTAASVAAVAWPQWSPAPSSYQTVLYGSLQVTPTGAAATSSVASERETVSPTVQYTALAYAYSPPGYGTTAAGSGLYAGITWYTLGGSPISTTAGAVTPVQPGEWTQLTLGPVFPPATAAFGAVVVAATAGPAGTVPATAVFYTGYAAFSPADSYQGAPPDQITWTDVSTRNITLGEIELTSGIQYENQSLEAGTMNVWLDNHDSAVTFGNVQSAFWPVIGDTDVPIRLRAIWPGSLTPYSVLFSGYTDDIKFGMNTETYYGYAQVQASDAWSRLTQQMLALTVQESLLDGPVALIPCNQTGANIISGNQFSSTQAVTRLTVDTTSGFEVPAKPPVASFTGGGISLPGASGQACWETTGTLTANADGGAANMLVWEPAAVLPVANGITVEFWYNPVSAAANQPQGDIFVCSALSSSSGGAAMWSLTIDNNTGLGTLPSQTFLYVSAFNLIGFSSLFTRVGTAIPFYDSAFSSGSYFISVTFSQSQITVTVNPGGALTESVTVTGLTLSSECTGFAWAALPGLFPVGGDAAISGIAVYTTPVPPARSAAHYTAGATAYAGELDTWRLARVASYSGFTPVLGMRGLDLPAAGSADVDVVTGATDTNTQVVSAYFTNVASSTLALMFVNGPGTLMYRRRQDWYNRPIGQWVTGDSDSQVLSLGINSLSAGGSVAGWTTGNGATLTTGTAPAAGQFFVPYAGLVAGNGSTANPFIATTSNPAITPGAWYQFAAWLYSAQGWTTGGVNAQIQFFNASNVQVGATASSPVVNLAAGSVGYATTGPVRAPATAAYLKAVIQVNGTPPALTGFYVAVAQSAQVGADYAPGAGVAVPETPYDPAFQFASDRAQLYNFAVLTQYGSNLISSFSGTSVLFTPSSGVIVITTNVVSASLRGQIPYTATIYLSNTAQATPYQLNEGSIEDVGNWITNTLSSPLLRPDKITLTPAQTPEAMLMALQSDVGDTEVFRFRFPGNPETQILTFISKITHNVDIGSEETPWAMELELSPFPQGSILTCDDVVHGVLTGQSLLGW